MFSTSLYPLVLHTLVFSTCAFALAAALVWYFRKSAPTVFLCCFGGIVIAGLIPVVGLLGSSILAPQVRVALPDQFNMAVQVDATSNNTSTNSIESDEAFSDELKPESLPADTSSGSSNPRKPTAQTDLVSQSYDGAIRVAIWTWMIVSIMMIMRFAFALISAYRLVTGSQPVKLSETDLSPNTVARLRESKIGLRMSENMSSPVAAQWPHRAIIVSSTFLFENSPKTAARVIEHECAHILRHDQLTLFAESFLSCFYWFHPLFHFLRVRLHQSREDICDNWVLTKFKPTDYCRDLVSLDQRSAQEAQLLPGFVNRRNISRRVRSMLNPSRQMATHSPRTLKWLLSVVSIGMIGIATLTTFVVQDSGKESTPDYNSPEFMKKLELAMQNFKVPKTLSATVTDAATGTPIESATVQLIEARYTFSEQRVIATVQTEMDGRFVFRDLDKLPGYPHVNLVVAISHKGHGSKVIGINSSVNFLLTPEDWKIKLPGSAVLSGKVVQPDGTPVEGAWVYQPMFLANHLENVLSAQTNAEGAFKISDHFKYKIPPARILGGGVSERSTGTGMMVWHPEFGRKRFVVTEIPGDVTVTIRKGFAVTGRVVDKSTGKPLAGITVSASGHSHRSHENATTNAAGVYSMVLMPDSDKTPVYGNGIRSGFNIWPRHSKLGCPATTVTAVPGKSETLPDFELDTLVSVHGKVIDDRTDKPLVSDGKYSIHWYGDARPNTTSECKSTPIKPDGTFEMKIVPGTVTPYIGCAVMKDVDIGKYKNGIKIERGKQVDLEFRVRMEKE
ncbi:MAG: M56 family metallopeptidase [Mariniblastus sp.]